MTEIKSNYMIDFKPIGIEDKELITTYFLACGNRDCNLSFVNLYTWQFLTNSHYAVVDDCRVHDARGYRGCEECDRVVETASQD